MGHDSQAMKTRRCDRVRGPLEGRNKEGVLRRENDRHKQEILIEVKGGKVPWWRKIETEKGGVGCEMKYLKQWRRLLVWGELKTRG